MQKIQKSCRWYKWFTIIVVFMMNIIMIIIVVLIAREQNAVTNPRGWFTFKPLSPIAVF